MSVDQDIWKIVAEKCCHTHQLRTVRNVARDLATLQSLCKSLTTCASSAWPEAAKLCQEGWLDYDKLEAPTGKQLKLPAKSMVADEVLQQVITFHPAQLQVFHQIQRDKAATVFAKSAKATYHLTDGDLKHLVPELTHNRYRPSTPCRLYKQQVTENNAGPYKQAFL